MRCDSCEALMINGVYCHELGCPNAATKCSECGSMFHADRRQAICDDCLPAPEEEDEEDWLTPSGVSDAHFDQHGG